MAFKLYFEGVVIGFIGGPIRGDLQILQGGTFNMCEQKEKGNLSPTSITILKDTTTTTLTIKDGHY